VTVRANSARTLTVEHPTAFYVLGPGAPTVRWAGQGITPAVGDVLYASGALSFELVGKAGANLLQIESTVEAKPGTTARLEHIDARRLRAYPIADDRGDVRLFLDEVEPLFAVDRLCAKKKASVPEHQHPGSDEIVYLMTGRAVVTVGDEPYTEKPGDLVSIPRGTPHAFVVTEDMCAVQVYAPAGPEQRFKK
jgi:quercetin dioxygenase-like cupin family protein